MTFLEEDRALAVARAARIPSAPDLRRALAVRTIELTFTTPHVLDYLKAAADAPDVDLGVGTVLTRDQAKAALEVGAQFLVTPGLRPAGADIANRRQNKEAPPVRF